MNPTNDRPDDEAQVAAWLAALNHDAPPPDRAFLDRLRGQTRDVFLAAGRQPSPVAGNRRMFTLLTRGLVAATLLVASGIGYHLFSRGPVPLDQVLATSGRATALHLRLTANGQVSELQVSQPGQLRWDHPDGTYQIVHGDKAWLVDEKENRATSRSATLFRATSPAELDVLALLPLSPEQQADLRQQTPREHVTEEGIRYHAYRSAFPEKEGLLQVEVLVDPRDQRLHRAEVARQEPARHIQLAELLVLAYDQPAPAEQFVVRDTLSEDGRIGKIADAQGTIAVRQAAAQRWTPVGSNVLLRPGDQVRTDVRGANAALVQLLKQTRVILGPGTLVELPSPTQIRLFDGELEITVPDKAQVELLGPDGGKQVVQGTKRFRVERQTLAAVPQEPAWLKGFKGATATEAIGSLVAKVDGRDVPLTVGYHKVRVEIRDQIARTTIEESFINRTRGQLEGVFHFPLPADASISGFGMWIGDELVMADIVEKQRAREIYETILREKRDPGLLEWAGGNLFKARVFPIFPNSEKRIQISYTQVLPLRGNTYRYGYALQSELLKQHPLKELALDVTISSVTPLKRVSSPTHATRDQQTPHAARVSFSAQEYTPTRDFEVVVELDQRQGDVVLIPHRRGDDGYFLMQLTPPAPNGSWERELLPDGEPLHVLLVADTSASMDAGQRDRQAAFITSFLAALTPKDRFNLAACDVTCDWLFDGTKPVTPGEAEVARAFLTKRSSLGWTDLEKAFASVGERLANGPRTHVIYVGDGTAVTKESAPEPIAARLTAALKALAPRATFHAVTPGSTYESVILKGIAAHGGSWRRITGESSPQTVARELLSELLNPTLRDLKIDFRGLRTARVYPGELPNLPAGAQQIVLGRYLPEGRDQAGEVVVTGRQGTQPVRFSSRVSLKDAEQGNSFIPRLWARMHLDQLLQQGGSESVRDEIIALSEEYQIITPYTSFLVLETDADRERFKVPRRFRMRDGERFFNEGQDQARYELVRQQMLRAGSWRVGLRRQVLNELSQLGRISLVADPRSGGEWAGRRNVPTRGKRLATEWFFDSEGLPALQATLGRFTRLEDESVAWDGAEPAIAGSPSSPAPEELGFIQQGLESDRREDDLVTAGVELRLSKDKAAFAPYGHVNDFNGFDAPGVADPYGVDVDSKSRFGFLGQTDFDGEFYAVNPRGEIGFAGGAGGRISNPYYRRQATAQYVTSLFPTLPRPPRSRVTTTTWPEEAKQLAARLLRRDKLRQLPGGLRLEREITSYQAERQEITDRVTRLDLMAPKGWLTKQTPASQQVLVTWCDGKELGIWNQTLGVGQVRPAKELDLTEPSLELPEGMQVSLAVVYRAWQPELRPQGNDRTLLVLRDRERTRELRLLIDTTRHVVLQLEEWSRGKRLRHIETEYAEDAASGWWPARTTVKDADGRITAQTTTRLQSLSAADFEHQLTTELADRDKALLLQHPLPTVDEAMAAWKHPERLRIESAFVLLVQATLRQQWPRADQYLLKLQEIAKDKPGMRWVRYAVLQSSRRYEDLKRELLAFQPANYALAEYAISLGASFLGGHELLSLLDRHQTLYTGQPAWTGARRLWLGHRLDGLRGARQPEAARSLLKEMAVEFPTSVDLQAQYARLLVEDGDFAAALAWLQQTETSATRWSVSERESLRSQHAEILHRQGKLQELAGYLETWQQQQPAHTEPMLRYLCVLILLDRADEAEKLALRWLREGCVPGERSSLVKLRLEAATRFLLADRLYYNLDNRRIEPRLFRPLAETALFFALRTPDFNPADVILHTSQFQESAEFKTLRRQLVAILHARARQLDLASLSRLLAWPLTNPSPEEAADWKRFDQDLRQRPMADAYDRQRLAELRQRLYGALGWTIELEELFREQLRTASAEYRAQWAQGFFQHLLNQPWSDAREAEAFSLLPLLGTPDQANETLRTRIGALYTFTDTMLRGRQQHLLKTITHPEKLTRQELRKQQEELHRKAHLELAQRLQGKPGDPLTTWITAERIYLLLRGEADPKEISHVCFEALGTKPRDLSSTDAEEGAVLTRIEITRYLVPLLHLAARGKLSADQIQRLTAWLDAGGQTAFYRERLVQLLIALDKPQELAKKLQTWRQEEVGGSRWQLLLASLLAEQGNLADALRLLEPLQGSDEITTSAYRQLSDWYQALNRKTEHEQARVATFQNMSEGELEQVINQQVGLWRRRDAHRPTQIDADLMLVYRALFSKARSLENHLRFLRELYQQSRDDRLVQVLAEAIPGHTAEQVYPFLHELQRNILNEVREEATIDSLIRQVQEVRKAARSSVDRRGLDLLEALAERRAAEVRNQPGPHAEAARAALVRSFKHEWAPGEPRYLAEMLARLGQIPTAALAEEQLRQLQALHTAEKPGTFDRLQIAQHRATTLAAYSRLPEAIDLLEVELRDFEAVRPTPFPDPMRDAFDSYVSLLEQARHFDKAERVVQARLDKPLVGDARFWLQRRLSRVYTAALEHEGQVALGKGEQLYRAAEQRVRREAAAAAAPHQDDWIRLMAELYRTAKNRKLPTVAADAEDFAARLLPEILPHDGWQYVQAIEQFGQVLNEVAGPRAALAFIVARLENEPAWLGYTSYPIWPRVAYQLSQWRSEVKVLGDLEERLLRQMVKQLRLDLQQSDQRTQYGFNRRTGYFWSEKTDVFARVVEELWQQQPRTEKLTLRLADYLYHGLERHDRAIEILFEANRQQLLSNNGQWELVHYLRQRDRYGETVALLEPLVERFPEILSYRLSLMEAYSRTKQPQRLRALHKETDRFFHEKDRWNADVLAQLAATCQQTELYEEALAYYAELIPWHQRTAPNRGIGDGQLSGFYQRQALAFAGLGRTAEAVEAASGSIVSWGPQIAQRRDAVGTLRQVLNSAPRLDEYVAHLDKQTTVNGQENPIVRKALGQVFIQKNEPAKAIKQLELAAAVQPNDRETWQLLLESYDKTQDKAGAVRQLLLAVELSRRDLTLYEELGKRLTALQQPREAERAYTSLVEMQPNETESHTRLAEIRQQQNRWQDAIDHWQRVVELRALEPTGLLKLAAAQIHEKQWPAARASVAKLKAKSWPERFNNLPHEIRVLEGQIKE